LGEQTGDDNISGTARGKPWRSLEKIRDAILQPGDRVMFRGFLADHGSNWASNDYNDDIMWMVTGHL
jgi:hypothetical protein